MLCLNRLLGSPAGGQSRETFSVTKAKLLLLFAHKKKVVALRYFNVWPSSHWDLPCQMFAGAMILSLGFTYYLCCSLSYITALAIGNDRVCGNWIQWLCAIFASGVYWFHFFSFCRRFVYREIRHKINHSRRDIISGPRFFVLSSWTYQKIVLKVNEFPLQL